MAEAFEFPDSLEGFGYKFNEDGEMRSISGDKPFNFEVKENDQEYNQKHYEALGEVITSHVYELLETDCGLEKLPVPHDPDSDEPQGFIFASQNALEADNLLVLIHGSGVVRAGQWARRLIINDSLKSGTQIPFIKRGVEEGYGVLVMNTNDNYRIDKGKRVPIRGSEDQESHGCYVWKHYIHKSKASNIAIIAHSYGGVVTTKLYNRFKRLFQHRVFAVAMTDSVHYFAKKADYKGLIAISQNWVCSNEPLDTPVPRSKNDVRCISAGCDKHEMTSWSSYESIFQFLKTRLTLRIQDREFLAPRDPVTVELVSSDDSNDHSPLDDNVENGSRAENIGASLAVQGGLNVSMASSGYATSGDEGVGMGEEENGD